MHRSSYVLSWYFFSLVRFETPANAKIHYATTGQEILNDFEGAGQNGQIFKRPPGHHVMLGQCHAAFQIASGTRLDYFVTGYGTGGTYYGAGKALREGSLADSEYSCGSLDGSHVMIVMRDMKQEYDEQGSPYSRRQFAAPIT